MSYVAHAGSAPIDFAPAHRSVFLPAWDLPEGAACRASFCLLRS